MADEYTEEHFLWSNHFSGKRFRVLRSLLLMLSLFTVMAPVVAG